MNAFRQQTSASWPGDLAPGPEELRRVLGSEVFLLGAFHRDGPDERLGAAGGDFRVPAASDRGPGRADPRQEDQAVGVVQRNEDRIAEAKELLSGDW
jgi:hypothetical protein